MRIVQLLKTGVLVLLSHVAAQAADGQPPASPITPDETYFDIVVDRRFGIVEQVLVAKAFGSSANL